MKKIVFLLSILFLLSGTRGYTQNGNNTHTYDDDIPLRAEQIIEQNKAGLVSIWFHTNDYYSYYTYSYTSDTTILNGSGFIISEEGIITTNYHVVESIDSILVKTSDGTFYDADLLLVDETNDIAILKIRNPNDVKFQTVKLGNSSDLTVGQDVFAVGSPLGFEYTISQGIIAAIRDEEKVSFTDPYTYAQIERTFERVIQITAAISPGNSGGALFNDDGEVIGITTYSYGFYGNLNFAIAINSLVSLQNSINLADIENDPEAQKRIRESLFKTNFKLASSYKSKLYYNWYYSQHVDTMTVLDTFAVKQDSLNKINFIKAENYYDKCIELEPDSFYIYSDLMDMYVYTDHFKKAEDLYKQIRERFSADDSLLNTLSSTLANAYTSSKEYSKALTFYQKMLEQDTNDAFIHFQIGGVYEEMNDYKNAVKSYKSALKTDSNYTLASVKLGEIYYTKNKDVKRAKKYLNEAYERSLALYGSPSYDIDLYYYLGLIAVEEGRKLDAILAYMEMKNIYTYSAEENQKKLDLYKEIKKMND